MLCIFLVLAMAGFVLASESTHKHTPSPAMAKQHHAMSTANKYWQAVKKSLQEGDFEKIGRSLEGMQKALADLEGFKPHKNAERIEDFREKARTFKVNLAALSEAVKDQDKAQTESLAAKIGNSCLGCHQVFR